MSVEQEWNPNGDNPLLPPVRAIHGHKRPGYSGTDSAGKRNLVKRGPKRRGKFVGVYYDRHAKKWRGMITVKGSLKHLGCFDKPETAAKTYDTWAKRFHGPRATLNFPQS